VKNAALTAKIQNTGLPVTAFQMFFFACFAMLAALVFAWYGRHYLIKDNYRQ